MLVYKGQPMRALVLTAGLFVLSQMWAQMAIEIEFPLTFKVGPETAVLFIR